MSTDPAQRPEGPSARVRGTVLALFFLSGISGLVYQIVWVRNFGLVFGNTLHSAALVTGVFMGGLGVGSLVMGRVADRRHARDRTAPLVLYGYAELVIAAFGILLAVLVPRLTETLASMSAYTIDPRGWHRLSTTTHAIRYAIAIAAIAPPTLLMGGTLTLLIRFVVGTETSAAGWRIGLLYGLNTAGAALGALSTDFALVPALGLLATQWVAVAANVVAGVGALVLARRLGDSEAGRSVTSDTTPVDPKTRRLVSVVATASLATGFSAMGIEILWFRFIGQITGAYRSVFSLLLAVILVGLWLGSVAGGWAHRRYGQPARTFAFAQAVVVVAFLGLLGVVDHYAAYRQHLSSLREAYASAGPLGRQWLALGANLRPALVVAAIPAFAMGFSFPLANALVQRAAPSVGRSAGALYLATTIGNVLGSVLVGFVLLPALGIRWTTFTLAAVATLAIVPMIAVGRAHPDDEASTRTVAPSLVAITFAALACGAFLLLPPKRLLAPAIPHGDHDGTRRLVTVSEGSNETLAVLEVMGVQRELYTNGHPMSSSSATSQRYMRGFSHIPLLHAEAPTDVLVICFGVGNTVHAASLHPTVERLDVADLSRQVLEHAHHFQGANHGVLEDDRVGVYVNDGRHHLQLQPEDRYDLITLEPPPIAFAGVAALYTRDFYALARSRLKPGGLMTQWLPIYQVPREQALALVRAFVEVFPTSVLLSGDRAELILMGIEGDDLTLAPDTLARRLDERPEVARDLDRVALADEKELFGSFVATADVLREATEGVPPVTDDRPTLEYAHHASIQPRDIPAALFDPSGLAAWCEGCEGVEGLTEYLGVMTRIYRSDVFLQGDGAALSFDDPAVRAVIDESTYLQYVLGGEALYARRLADDHLRSGDLEKAYDAFRRVLYLAPGDPDALFGIGRVFARLGEQAMAEDYLQRTLIAAPDHPRANAVMCRRAADDGRLDEARARCAVAERGGVALSPQLAAKIAPEDGHPPRTRSSRANVPTP